MDTLLIRSLSKAATRIRVAETTSSQYFEIGCIKVRISDHASNNNTFDLSVFRSGKGYTVIPNIGTFREVRYFTNVDALMHYIVEFEYFAKIFVKNTLPKKTQSEESIPDWKPKMHFLLDQKKPDLTEIITKIFETINPVEWTPMISKLRTMVGGLSAEKRKTYLEKIYSDIVNS